MTQSLSIIPSDLLLSYLEQTPKGLEESFRALHDAEISTDTFSFYTSSFSSKIEGGDIELDSYIKHKKFGIEFLPDYTQKIDDLYNAYSFAKTSYILCLKSHISHLSNTIRLHKRLSIRSNAFQ